MEMESGTFTCKKTISLINGRVGTWYCLEQLVKVQYVKFCRFGLGNKKYNTNKKMVRIGLLNVRSINNKVDDVYGMIYDGLNILVLCETWHGTEGNISVRLAMPPGFTFVDFVRPHDPGQGGLFEALAIRLKIGIDQFCLIALYRPGSEQTTSLFFEELISMLEFITMSEAHVVLTGDFNIHVEKRDSLFTLRLHEILDMFQLVNHVSGGTLDLVICSQNFPIFDTKIDPCSVYSDHSYVGVRVALNQVRPKLVKACVRPWKDLNEKCFVEALANFPVANKCQSDDGSGRENEKIWERPPLDGICIEVLGPMDPNTLKFLKEICKMISVRSGDSRMIPRRWW
ncbi:hypothetical protein HELRODRAFT_179147 [Helobdella robusta]|uniref:Endonuclease/exonuclease/phosphatase domain-containing protein n=1 Tax=Helobdella robusta TaxID=6412 RepID=T1FE90_HELRO|nr:hypothetical protein HELRODRAFT_179147 [Helobdella robusta]ESN95676.1 hypothetical protein HELRODRAFT_179147 [Helobdella robusta]